MMAQLLLSTIERVEVSRRIQVRYAWKRTGDEYERVLTAGY